MMLFTEPMWVIYMHNTNLRPLKEKAKETKKMENDYITSSKTGTLPSLHLAYRVTSPVLPEGIALTGVLR